MLGTDYNLHLSKKLRTVFPSSKVGSLVTPSTSATVLYKSSMYWGGCLWPRRREAGGSSIPKTSKRRLIAADRTSSDLFWTGKRFPESPRKGLEWPKSTPDTTKINTAAENMSIRNSLRRAGDLWTAPHHQGFYIRNRLRCLGSSVNSDKEVLFDRKCKSIIGEM